MLPTTAPTLILLEGEANEGAAGAFPEELKEETCNVFVVPPKPEPGTTLLGARRTLLFSLSY